MASQRTSEAPGLTIDRVRTRAALGEFITLPRRLYDGMPGFVAPLDHERQQLLDPNRSAFFSHGVACYFIARSGGRALGRVSAQIDFAADSTIGHRIGLFGCLDAVDDGEVVAALLQSAETWLRERGCHIVRGPFLLSINGEPGLLADGQMEPPVTLLGWHPAYLDRHVRAAGYGLATRLESYRLTRDEFAFDDHLQDLAKVRSRAQLTIRPLRTDRLDSEMEAARCIFNDAWQQNWGFTPATPSDVADLVRQFRPFIYPDCGFFIDIRGEPAAFVLSMPNLFEITADLGPRPGVFGWMKLVYRVLRPQFRSFRLFLLGVAVKYRSSVVGGLVSTVAFEEVRRSMRARNAEELTIGWVLEQNHAARSALQALGIKPTRVYNIYQKAVDPGAGCRGTVD